MQCTPSLTQVQNNIAQFHQMTHALKKTHVHLKVLVTYHLLLGDQVAGQNTAALLENWGGFKYANHSLVKVYTVILVKISKNFSAIKQCKSKYYYNLLEIN